MITAGVDLGSTTAKVVIIDGGELKARAVAEAGYKGDEVARTLFRQCLAKAELDESEVAACISTGYGRARIDFADRNVTEITCHAKGARYLLHGCRFVIDMGGQDSKAIALDADGKVVDFAMNDKCAAGTGRFLEVMTKALEMDFDEFSEKALKGMDRAATISSICTVFAESEVIGQVTAGTPIEEIAAGICISAASRVAGMIARLPLEKPVIFTGGVSANKGVLTALEKRLNTKIHRHELSQYAGAIGAAMIAAEA